MLYYSPQAHFFILLYRKKEKAVAAAATGDGEEEDQDEDMGLLELNDLEGVLNSFHP